jgi:regulator of sigma E protease
VESIVETVLFFILLIGVLVFVHEGGHFLMAKLFGVKVQTFSLGFGPKLFGLRKGETLYKISAVPFGGYVKMLGEDDPAEERDPADAGRGFHEKPGWQRALILIGGPAMNLLFPLLLHFAVGLTETRVDPPEIGYVLAGSPAAQAGLLPGDRIVGVEGAPVRTFDEMRHLVAPHPGVPLRLRVERGGTTFETAITPAAAQVTVLLDVQRTVGRLGVAQRYLPPVIGITDRAAPAARAGLRTFDRVAAMDGLPLERWVDLERALTGAAGRTVRLTVERGSPALEAGEVPRTLELSLALPAGIEGLVPLGLDVFSDFVEEVEPAGAADLAGLEPGDRLISIDGGTPGAEGAFAALGADKDGPHLLGFARPAEERSYAAVYALELIPAGAAKDLGIASDVYEPGLRLRDEATVAVEPIANPAPLAHAWRHAVTETADGFEMTVLGFQLLVQGKISMRTLGGPIMIGQLAGMAGREGARPFLWMMALISINLGLINLLPIPIFDGGHLRLLVAETVRRRPLGQRFREKLMLVGLAFVLFLMVFVTWNDISRILVGE